jgi:hypothetical protein
MLVGVSTGIRSLGMDGVDAAAEEAEQLRALIRGESFHHSILRRLDPLGATRRQIVTGMRGGRAE